MIVVKIAKSVLRIFDANMKIKPFIRKTQCKIVIFVV